jgi:hypothetical protein
MVALNSFLQICTILLAIHKAHASHQTLVRRVVDDLQITAARKTHNLAKDLRVAFNSILPRAVSSSQPRHVVYCKPARQAPFSPGSSGGGTNNTSVSLTRTGSSTRRPTSTRVGSSPTPTATSSWRLLESHVCLSEFCLILVHLTRSFCRLDLLFSMLGTFLLVQIQRMVCNGDRLCLVTVY